MQTFASIEPNLARECFAYDAATGNLIWRIRPGAHMKARNTRWAGTVAGHEHTCTVGKKYIQVRVSNALHYAHRIVWVLHRGPIPPGMQVDHIADGDGTNNRIENLRLVTSSGNKKNQRRMKSNTSGYTGVYRSGKRWAARVWTKEKFITIGYRDTPQEAFELRKVYNAAHGFHPNHGADRPL